MTRQAPLTYQASSLARNTAAAATSAGRAARPNRFASRSSTWPSAVGSPATTPAVIPLTVAPGAMALTRTPAGISSTPADSVSPTPAGLPAVYACGPSPPRTPAVLAVFTMAPYPCAHMTRAPCLIPRNTLVNRTAMVRSQSSRAVSTTEPTTPRTPALLNRQSSPPSSDTATSTRPATSSSTLTSARTKRTASPSSWASSRPRSACRSPITQRPPSATRRRTIPSPMPLAPPVTTLTLPSNRAGTCLPASLELGSDAGRSGADHGGVARGPDQGAPPLAEPPAVRGSDQLVVVAARDDEVVAARRPGLDVLGLQVAGGFGPVA